MFCVIAKRDKLAVFFCVAHVKCFRCVFFLFRREMKFLHLNQVKTTEAQEMETIRDLRRALAEKRKMAAESRVVALSSIGYEPMRSKMPVTRPQEFQFASDARLKGPPADSGPASLWKEVDFAAELRKPTDKVSLFVIDTSLFCLP